MVCVRHDSADPGGGREAYPGRNQVDQVGEAGLCRPPREAHLRHDPDLRGPWLTMMPIVVKAGGSGNIVETDSSHPIPWLSYRRLKFAESYVDDLIEGLRGASALRTIAFVPGGMGAYLHLDLARHAGVSDPVLAEIGRSI